LITLPYAAALIFYFAVSMFSAAAEFSSSLRCLSLPRAPRYAIMPLDASIDAAYIA